MRTRQYYLTPFSKEYTTKLISSSLINNEYHVVLANTIFYPEGGGQPADRGYLNNSKVIDVYEKNGTIYHIVDNQLQNDTVKCILDWEHRFYYMQQHTGQHLMSAVFYRNYNYQTKSFHLNNEYATIDIATPQLAKQMIVDAEIKINQLIYDSIPIKCYFTTSDQLQELDLRKQPQVKQDIRIVELEGVDAVPCCGTHLKNSGQVGLIKIIKTEKHKKTTRIYFRCGLKAFQDYQDNFNTVSTLANRFSAAHQDTLRIVTGELDLKKQLEHDVSELKKKLFHLQVKELIEKTHGQIIEYAFDDQPIETAQLFVREILACGKFIAAVSTGNRLIIASNLNSGFNCGKMVEKYAPQLSGRGGGNSSYAQVYFLEKNKLERFKDLIRTHIN